MWHWNVSIINVEKYLYYLSLVANFNILASLIIRYLTSVLRCSFFEDSLCSVDSAARLKISSEAPDTTPVELRWSLVSMGFYSPIVLMGAQINACWTTGFFFFFFFGQIRNFGSHPYAWLHWESMNASWVGFTYNRVKKISTFVKHCCLLFPHGHMAYDDWENSKRGGTLNLNTSVPIRLAELRVSILIHNSITQLVKACYFYHCIWLIFFK